MKQFDVAEIINNIALLYQKQHRYDDAASSLKEALRIRSRALGNEHLDVAETVSNLAELCKLQHQLEKAELMHLRRCTS